MVALWHTGHQINREVMQAVKRGFIAIAPNKSYPLKYPNEYKGEPENVSYGILRGVDDIYKRSHTYWELDRGYFKPSHFDGYYRISRNNTRATYNHKVAMQLSDYRLDMLKLKVDDWNYNPNGFVVLCPPSDYVADYFDIDDNWLEVREKFFKSHEIPVRIRDKQSPTSLKDDLRGARALVTYNSNAAIDALLLGIPVVAESPDVFGWNGAVYQDVVENPNKLTADRKPLFRFLSYCQFTLAEFASGLAWRITQGVQM